MAASQEKQVEEFLASDEVKGLGVLGRDRALREKFPEVDREIRRSAAKKVAEGSTQELPEA